MTPHRPKQAAFEANRHPPRSAALPTQWLPLGAAIVLLAAAGVFQASLDNGWSGWDDRDQVVLNADIRQLDRDAVETWFSTTYNDAYVPLTMLSYALDYAVHGLEPRGYHRTGLVLHLVNIVLVLLVTRSLFRLAGERGALACDPARAGSVALMTAAFFALHPLQVESVAWAGERKGLLCACFLLLMLLAYLRAVRAERLRRIGWLLVSTAFMAMAMLSKQTAVVAPVWLILLDVYPLRRVAGTWASLLRRSTLAVLLEKLPFVLIAGLGVIRAVDSADTYDRLALERIGMVFRNEGFLFVKFVAPVNLSSWYSVPFDLTEWHAEMLLATCVWLAALATGAAVYSRRPGYLMVLLAWTLSLLPVSGAVPWSAQATAERYAYLPMLPLLWLGAFGVLRAIERWPRARLAALACVLLSLAALGLATHQRIGVWAGPESVFLDQIRGGGQQVDAAHYNLGLHYLSVGRSEDAEAQLERAIEIRPSNADAHFALALQLAASGRFRRAGALLREAVALAPHRHVDMWEHMLGVVDAGGQATQASGSAFTLRCRCLAELHRFAAFDAACSEPDPKIRESMEYRYLVVDRWLYQRRIDRALEVIDTFAAGSLPPRWEARRQRLLDDRARLTRKLESIRREIDAAAATDARLLQLGETLLMLGQFGDAAAALEGIEAGDPAGPAAIALARIHALREEHDQALRAIERAAALGVPIGAEQLSQLPDLRGLDARVATAPSGR